MLLSEDRCASGHTADDRQAGVVGLGLEPGNANPAGSTGRHFDRAFAGKRLEVLFCRVWRFETQFLSDFRTGWRVAVVF